MSKSVYICVGNCMSEISKELFDSGNKTCQKKDCSKYKEGLVELPLCECGADCCRGQETASRELL